VPATELTLWICAAYSSCGGAILGEPRHVFESPVLPPADDARCECGAVTWAEAVEVARKKRMRLASATEAEMNEEPEST